jgi:hypothetical protein
VLLNLRHFVPGPAEYAPHSESGPIGGLAFAANARALTTTFTYESAVPMRDDRAWMASAPEEDYEMYALRPRAEA